jgi:hypothetical protein
MDKEIQKEIINKLYLNPLQTQIRRQREKEAREKEVREKEAREKEAREKEATQKVLFRTTQPALTNMNTNDYIDKLFNDKNDENDENDVNNSNINNLLTDLERVYINNTNREVKKQETRKRKRKGNQENNIKNVKKIKLELEKIQEKIKELEYIFHMGKSTPPTKKELKERNVLRRKKQFAKTYKISNKPIIPYKIIYKPLSKATITRKLNRLKEQEEALKLIIEKRLRSGKL